MIAIDGSYGEGGGQIVRTAITLSAITSKGVKIERIREARPKSGLAPQHVQAILALAHFCDAKITGVRPGSSEITFKPGKIKRACHKIDIGTAGSVTLLMQCLLPAMLKLGIPSSLEIHGGTDVKWSPTIDYFRHVFLPAICSFGARAKMELKQRGYYPKGQGHILLKVEPSELKPAHFKTKIKGNIKGISHCSNLPEHVAKRQAAASSQALELAGFESKLTIEILHLPSTGSGITLWNGFIGGSALGERGLPAEDVGRKAAEQLISEFEAGGAVDVYLADQLIPYIALIGGSYTTKNLSMHTKTNIWTAEHFLEKKISVSEEKIFTIEAMQR